MKIINFGSLNIDKVCSVEEFVQPGETIMATGYSVNAVSYTHLTLPTIA